MREAYDTLMIIAFDTFDNPGLPQTIGSLFTQDTLADGKSTGKRSDSKTMNDMKNLTRNLARCIREDRRRKQQNHEKILGKTDRNEAWHGFVFILAVVIEPARVVEKVRTGFKIHSGGLTK